jgi:Protein of unknown function (DUF2934)
VTPQFDAPIVTRSALDADRALEKIYQAAKPRFEAALQHSMEWDRSFRDWYESRVERFGREAIPEVEQFVQEVRADLARIDGWESAWLALFGESLDAAARERWIREAAYFRAEKRGFAGGSAADDWAQAELECERRHQGVIGRCCAGLWSLGERLGREIDGMRDRTIDRLTRVSRSLDQRSV